MTTADNKRYRVVVVGVASGLGVSPGELASALESHFPLAPDARLAIESGRSAVVQVVESERYARRAATMLIKLGAEIRIEPEEGGDLSPLDALDLDEIEESIAGLADDLVDSQAFATKPASMEPPEEVDEDAPTLVPQPSVSRRSRRSTRELAPVSDGSSRVVGSRPGSQVSPRAAGEPPPGEERGGKNGGEQASEADSSPLAATQGAERAQLVRCPAHGLLYDATRDSGCTRCRGPGKRQPHGLAPRLRKRPRLWLGMGLALSLLLGGVPAAIYAQRVKSGALYERRMEADSIRRSTADPRQHRRQYERARARVSSTRFRGMALSSLIWISVAAGLMLLWYRFI